MFMLAPWLVAEIAHSQTIILTQRRTSFLQIAMTRPSAHLRTGVNRDNAERTSIHLDIARGSRYHQCARKDNIVPMKGMRVSRG